MFSAGTETPSTQITWGLFYVMKYPDVQARLHRELDNVVGAERLPELSDRPNLPCLDAFLTEMVRIVSETPLAIPHLTMRDTSLAGFYIPRDMSVIVNLWAIHHDLEYWGDPFTFRPDRSFLGQGRTAWCTWNFTFLSRYTYVPWRKVWQKSSFLVSFTIASQV